ncbi:MAG TPA: type VI secretion system protein TssL, long form [Rhizobiaceae bacterium]|nr:type VI secretion system protein TssL, long form [Rhizobiaceae bacterium]
MGENSRCDIPGTGGQTVIRPSPARRQLHPAHSDTISPGATVIDLDAAGHAPSGWAQGTVIYQAAPALADPDAPRRKSTVRPSDGADRKLATGLGLDGGTDGLHANPIVVAAMPLLTLLGHIRSETFPAEFDELGSHAIRAIRDFERRLADAGIKSDTLHTAKLALCATTDDVIRNLPGAIGQDWARNGMLSHFFPAADPASSFFEALNPLLADPEPHCEVLEFMHHCLSLGFEGQYRNRPARAGFDLEQVRHDVYETLRYFKPRAADEISPHWQGLAVTSNKPVRMPLWSIAAVATALVTGCFFMLRALLTLESDAVSEKLLALNPTTPITIERAEQASFLPLAEVSGSTGQFERIRSALAQEIEAGKLSLVTRGDFIVIEINNRLLFEPGKAEVKSDFLPIALNVAAALEPEKGTLQIIGHTDNTKLRKSSPFASNYDLSVARAKAVEKALSPGLTDPSRITVAGKGETEPIADNTTAEGRAANRRVDVLIAKEQAP